MSLAVARQAMPLPPPVPPEARVQPSPELKVLIRDVDFYYGDFKALKSITLPLHDKRVTAFIGPSGCGKSTLLYLIGG